jgi:hypothetical protein
LASKENIVSTMKSRPSEHLGGVRHSLSLAFAALVAGSRSIPLGDNGSLLRELARRSADPTAPSTTRSEAARQ